MARREQLTLRKAKDESFCPWLFSGNGRGDRIASFHTAGYAADEAKIVGATAGRSVWVEASKPAFNDQLKPTGGREECTIFMNAEQARELAAQLIKAADESDAWAAEFDAKQAAK